MDESSLPGSIGEWIRLRRRALDLTQTELAQRVGCSVFALRKIESGERRPSKQLAGLLARSLEIPQEDHPVFIRVARGELNFERLRPPPATPARRQPPSPIPVTAFNNLPLMPTPLIGREPELAAACSP
jgi:transcriptional regulator with XRE-family HTH domain